VLRHLAVSAILTVCVSACLAADKPLEKSPFFIEMWNNAAYYGTNLEKPRFASALVRSEGKAGLNFFNYPIQFYGVYYGVASQSDDYWDNSLFSGAGVRILPFSGLAASGWLADIFRAMKFYSENLNASYLKDNASAEAAGLAKTDRRSGVEIYQEWNLDNANYNSPWTELWFNYSSRTTNFGWEDFNSYVMYLQTKFGRHLGDGIEVYLRGDITSSGKDTPSYYFINVADYGVGVRFEPWRNTGTADDLMRKFKMFAEVLGVSYLRNKPADQTKVVDSDVRFGVEFSYGR